MLEDEKQAVEDLLMLKSTEIRRHVDFGISANNVFNDIEAIFRPFVDKKYIKMDKNQLPPNDMELRVMVGNEEYIFKTDIEAGLIVAAGPAKSINIQYDHPQNAWFILEDGQSIAGLTLESLYKLIKILLMASGPLGVQPGG